MKKNTKNNVEKKLIKNIKEYCKKYLIVIGIVIIAIVIAIITTSNKQEKTYSNPQLDPNYKGFYDESSGKVKIIKFFDGKDYVIDDCVFSELKFTYSPSNSSFTGWFTSNNDNITGIVHIDFALYDKNKKVVKKFYNELKNVEKGQKKEILAEYLETIDNVDSVNKKIEK